MSAAAAGAGPPDPDGPLRLDQALRAGQEALKGYLARVPETEVIATGVIGLCQDGSFYYPVTLVPTTLSDDQAARAFAATLRRTAADLTGGPGPGHDGPLEQ